MAIPPQFLKHKKSSQAAAEDAKDGGKDDSQEDSNGNLKGSPKGAPKKDSKDPKGAKFDAIPSGPMKGKNPNDFKKGKGNTSNAKRAALLAQLRGGK